MEAPKNWDMPNIGCLAWSHLGMDNWAEGNNVHSFTSSASLYSQIHLNSVHLFWHFFSCCKHDAWPERLGKVGLASACLHWHDGPGSHLSVRQLGSNALANPNGMTMTYIGCAINDNISYWRYLATYPDCVRQLSCNTQMACTLMTYISPGLMP